MKLIALNAMLSFKYITRKKNDFAEISENLARYRSKNNCWIIKIIIGKSSQIVMSNAKSFDILVS